MMFGRVSAAWLAIIATAVIPLAAQGQVSLAVGRSMPSGEFADEAVTGWTLLTSYNRAIGVLPVGLRVDGIYQTFRNVEREPGLYVSNGGEWFRQVGVVLNATREIQMGMVRPYALLGLGMLKEWHGDYSYSGTEQWGLNANAGMGLNLSLGGRGRLFVEARGLFGNKALRMTPPAVHPEVKFQSFPVLVGVRL